MVHSHLQFSKLLREPELIDEQWVTLYYMGTFTPVICSTIAWTEKFNNGLCTHFLRLHELKRSRNSSRLKNLRCELSLKPRTPIMGPLYSQPNRSRNKFRLLIFVCAYLPVSSLHWRQSVLRVQILMLLLHQFSSCTTRVCGSILCAESEFNFCYSNRTFSLHCSVLQRKIIKFVLFTI